MVGVGKTKKQTFEQRKCLPKTFMQSETQRKKFMHEQTQIKQLWPQGSQDGGQILHPLATFFYLTEHF